MNNIPQTVWEITHAEMTALQSKKDYNKSRCVEGQDFVFSFKRDISKKELDEKTKLWGIRDGKN